MKKKSEILGQSLVELAISFLILLIILSVVVDLGRLFYFYIALRDAAQEGVIYASVHPNNDAAIRGRVRGSSDSPFDLASLTDSQIELDPTVPGKRCAGETSGVRNGITVTVQTDFVFITPLASMITADHPIELTADVTDTILTPLCN